VATIHLSAGRQFHFCHLLTNGCQFEKLLLNEGIFRGCSLLAPGDNLSSACDDASLRKQADTQYAAFLERTCLLSRRWPVCWLIRFGSCCENVIRSCSAPSLQLILQALRFLFHS